MENLDTLESLPRREAAEGMLWKLAHRERHSQVHPHRHAEIEFNLMVSGSAAYLLRDRRGETVRRYPMRRGSLLFLYPEQEHVLIEPSDDFSIWILVMGSAFVPTVASRFLDGERLASAYPAEKVGVRLDELETRHLETLLGDVATSSTGDPGVFVAGLEYALARAWDRYRVSEELQPGSAIHPAVARAARLLQQGGEELSLPNLARGVGISSSHLSKLFHEQTGETLVAFRNRQRLERFHSSNPAEGTLLSRALDAGFGSYAQFHRVHSASRL